METNLLYYSHTFFLFYSCFLFILEIIILLSCPCFLQYSLTIFLLGFFSNFIIFFFDCFPLNINFLMFIIFLSHYFLFSVGVLLFPTKNKEWNILIYFLSMFWCIKKKKMILNIFICQATKEIAKKNYVSFVCSS